MELRPLPLLTFVGLLAVPHPLARGQAAALAEARRDVAAQSERPQFRGPTTAARLRSQTTGQRDGSTVADSEFGEQQIVQRRAQVEPWSVVADTQLFRTDNVALTSTGERNDWYLRYGLAVSYTNRIQGPLFLDLSLQQYLFRYSKFDVLDFGLTRFDGGLLLQVPRLADAFFFGRYKYQRLAEGDFGSEFFTSHSLELGVQKVWKISRGQRVFAGLSTDIALETDPESARRHAGTLTVGYSARLTEALTGGVSYSGTYYDYTQGGRADWNHILALGFTYDVTDWLRLGTNASYSINESDFAFADYRNLVLGGNVSLRLAF